MNAYAGESAAKRLARGYILERVCRRLMFDAHAGYPIGGDLVTLAGPKAVEWRVLRSTQAIMASFARDHITRATTLEAKREALSWAKTFASSSVVLVDRDRTGLDHALHEGFDGRVHHGELVDYIRESSSIRFVHLDLMGPINRNLVPLFTALSTKLGVGGCFAVTFLRGRENFGDAVTLRAQQRASNMVINPEKDQEPFECGPKLRALMASRSEAVVFSDTKLSPLDVDRFVGGWKLIKGWLGSGYRHELVAATRYDSGRSPMGMLLGRRYSKYGDDARRAEDAIRRGLPTDDMVTVRTFRDSPETETEVRRLALQHADENELEYLCVPPAQIAAWKAVRTRSRLE